MTIRLYLDEDAMSDDLVQALRTRGVDVFTTADAGMVGSTDEQQLEYATSQGRVLYSFNRADFYAIHTSYLAQGWSHTGIILAPQRRYPVGEQLRRLVNLIHTKSAEEMRDQVEFLGA